MRAAVRTAPPHGRRTRRRGSPRRARIRSRRRARRSASARRAAWSSASISSRRTMPERPHRHARLERRRPSKPRQHVVAERSPGGVEQLDHRRAVVERRAVGRFARSRARPPDRAREAVRVEQLEQIPLDLARPPPDHRVFDRADRAGQVGERLHHAHHAPAQRAQELPPAQRVRVDASVRRGARRRRSTPRASRARRPDGRDGRTATPGRTATRDPRRGRRDARAPSRARRSRRARRPSGSRSGSHRARTSGEHGVGG